MALGFKFEVMLIGDIQDLHWTANGKSAMDIYCRLVFAADPCEFSALYMLTYVAQAGGAMKLADVKGGAQESMIGGGTERIPNSVAEFLGGHPKCILELNQPIAKIVQTEDGVEVESGTAKRWRARHVVVAIPPTVRVYRCANFVGSGNNARGAVGTTCSIFPRTPCDDGSVLSGSLRTYDV